MMKILDLLSIMSWASMFTMVAVVMAFYLHPMILTCLLVFYNLLMFMNLSILKNNFMYSIMLFLVMISGLMIIFMYFSSTVSNETQKTKCNYDFTLTFTSISAISIYIYISVKSNNFASHLYKEIYPMDQLMTQNYTNNFQMIYEYPLTYFTTLSIFYLLLTLFIIIKICNSSLNKSLRKIN